MSLKKALSQTSLSVFKILNTRFELLSFELRIGFKQFTNIAIMLAIALLFFFLALVVFSIFILSFYECTPDYSKAAGFLALGYFAFSLIFLLCIYIKMKAMQAPFVNTMAELREDMKRLEDALSDDEKNELQS